MNSNGAELSLHLTRFMGVLLEKTVVISTLMDFKSQIQALDSPFRVEPTPRLWEVNKHSKAVPL